MQAALCASPMVTSAPRQARPSQNFSSRPQRPQQRAARRAVSVRAAVWAPPPVSDAKQRFFESFKRPLPGLYATVVQELLVQQHLYRWNKDYSYNEVNAVGLVSIFEQVLSGLPDAERSQVFESFILALQEDPALYRADAARLEAWAKGLESPEGIKPDAAGGDGQKALAAVAEAVAAGHFHYNKFFAIGLFRLLELAGAKDPKALGSLVAALGVPQERVTADLLTYKGVLSKLQAAKEIMKEFLEREKKKQAERDAAKAAKAAAAAPADATV